MSSPLRISTTAVALLCAAATRAQAAPAPDGDPAGIEDLKKKMNEGRKGEPLQEYCARLKQLWEAGRKYRQSNDDGFHLARAVVARTIRELGCPKPAGFSTVSGPSLWERFETSLAQFEKASSPADRNGRQAALTAAAVLLIHQLSPKDPRFDRVLDVLARSVVPKDQVAALQSLLGSLVPADLRGDEGKRVADAVAAFAARIPPNLLGEQHLDALVVFASNVAKTNPAWLKRDSAGHLLAAVLQGLGQLPPDTLGAAQIGLLFDFAARIVARDPQWLQGERGKLIAAFVPRLVQHLDVATVKPDDLDGLLSFTMKVLAGRPDWPEHIRRMVEDWDKILEIVVATRHGPTRAVLREAIHTLREREGEGWAVLEKEVDKTQPDPAMVTTLLRTLGMAKVEAIRRQQAALQNRAVMLATHVRLRTLIGLRLPADCPDTRRDADDPGCVAAYTFADTFRSGLVAGAPEGADLGPPFRAGMREALDDAACTLGAATPDVQTRCTAYEDVRGTFASYVGLEVERVDPADRSGGLVARAGCIVVSATQMRARVDEIKLANIPSAAEAKNDAVIKGTALAQLVLDRCPLSLPHDDLAANLLQRGRVHQSAPSALVFAGLPYLRDGRKDGPSRGLAWSIAAADAATLAFGAGSLLGAAYVHGSSGPPWDDRLLRGGVISLGLNIAVVKVGSALLYHFRYGGGR